MRERKEFFIGDLVRFKDDGSYGIIDHSYRDAFGSGSHAEFDVVTLDEEGNIDNSIAWVQKSELELISTEHREENLKKIRAFHKGSGAPICMKPELAEMLGYGFVHTYETARM